MDFFDSFNTQILQQTCSYKNKLVGLPTKLNYSVLYANEMYLKKHKKRIPKTWDELIETSKYILREEKKLNNTQLLAYNGLFNDEESGIFSINEMIYSFRKTVDSPLPKIRSQEAIDALNMIKKIKNEIASDDIFRSSDKFSVLKLFDITSALFIKYWNFHSPIKDMIPYKMAILPGHMEGISGATVSGYNMGINKFISEENINASIVFINFIFSREIQKHYVENNMLSTGMNQLYKDREVCEKIDCELYNSLQILSKQTNITFNIDEYNEKVKSIYNKFIYGNESAEMVLKEIEDITKIYYISLSTEDSYIGLVAFIVYCTTSALMIVSLLFLFKEDYTPFFEFLPTDFWIITILGEILILSIGISGMGQLKEELCELKPIFFSFGYTFILVPLLYRLIINFPEEIYFPKWVYRHRYQFFLIFILIDFLLNSIVLLISPFKIKTINVKDGQNFNKCIIRSFFGQVILWVQVFYILIITIIILSLSFIEWNLHATFYDIRFLISALYIDILSSAIYLFLESITINNYLSYYVVRGSILFIMTISNYSFLYGYKLFSAFLKKKNLKLVFIKKINKNFVDESDNSREKSAPYNTNTKIEGNVSSMNTLDDQNKSSTDYNNDEFRSYRRNSIFSKVLSYHYTTEGYSVNDIGIQIYDEDNEDKDNSISI
ncbi:hypothetical protein U3516DRAFT_607950 [Neocallimastix sp. 'constans']